MFVSLSYRSAVAGALSLAVATLTPAGADPYADTVVSYTPGTDANPSYLDPAGALGSPERFTGEGVFPSVVSPFNPPFGADELVSIGIGGEVVLAFDEPIVDDPANPFGVDLLVFGNAFFIDDFFPDAIIGGIFGGGGRLDVSADGVTWVTVADPATGFLPTLGYVDSGPYDSVPGVVPTDFTRPVDPAFGLGVFLGLDYDGLRAHYDGAGGGTNVDLATTGLASISFVRIVNPAGATGPIALDAVSDVRAVVVGDVDGDGVVDFGDLVALLSAWGPCASTCAADLDGNGSVGFDDLLLVLGNWS